MSSDWGPFRRGGYVALMLPVGGIRLRRPQTQRARVLTLVTRALAARRHRRMLKMEHPNDAR